MKKALCILLASSLFLFAGCSSAGSFAGSITIDGTVYEWKAQTQEENLLIYDCINDILNGSQSLKDNIDYYLLTSVEDNEKVITLFNNVYSNLEE